VTFQSWFIYLTLAILAALTPGPAILLITTNATLYGWKKSVFAALGNIFGLFCMGIVTVAGLGVILESSILVFNVVRYLGAAYLIYLGVQLFLQKNGRVEANNSKAQQNNISRRKLFFQAFGVAVSNPKAIVFLTALFPQFVNVQEPLAIQFVILITTLMVVSFSFLMFYAFLTDRVRGWLNMSGRDSIVRRASGLFFISIGILLGASSQR